MKEIMSTICPACIHDPVPPNGTCSKFLEISAGVTNCRSYLSKDP